MRVYAIAVTALTLLLPAPAKSLTAQSTAYCLQGQMADGTYVRSGSAASNSHPLGTKLLIRKGGPEGRRLWVVRDRIGHSSDLDFWVSSCSYALNSWGRRTVEYSTVRYVKRSRWREAVRVFRRWGSLTRRR